MVGTATVGTPVLRLVLHHDYNDGTNEAGFYQEVLPSFMEGNFHTGDEVVLLEDAGEFSCVGRIRCLIAVIEQIEPFVFPPTPDSES